MRSLLTLDTAQLSRLQAKLAELEAEPTAEQVRKWHLLEALRAEEKSLRRYNPRLHARAGADLVA